MTTLDCVASEKGKISFEQHRVENFDYSKEITICKINATVTDRNGLSWSKDLPTKEGWYWLKRDEDFEIIYIHYDAYDDPYIEGRDLYERLTERKNHLWYGPIEPPK